MDQQPDRLKLAEQPEIVLNELVAAVKLTGGIGVVGVYVPQDPGASNDLAKEGSDLITAGKATPGFLVSHELELAEAATGYDHFDKGEDGWTKVVLHPAA